MSGLWITVVVVGAVLFGGTVGAFFMAVVAGGSRRGVVLDHTYLSRGAGQ